MNSQYSEYSIRRQRFPILVSYECDYDCYVMAKEWCGASIGTRMYDWDCSVLYFEFYFKNKEDAIMFKLSIGGI